MQAQRRKQWSPEERAAWEQQQEEERRRKNERRLEGQRQEFERKRDAQRKAEEEAAARTPSLVKETSDEGKPHVQQRKVEAPRVHGGQQTSERMEGKADDQKAATGTSAVHLGDDIGTASPTPMNEEFLGSHLMSRVCVPRSPWHNETVMINSFVMMGIPLVSQSQQRPLRRLPQRSQRVIQSRITWDMAMPTACARATRQAWKPTTSSMPRYDRSLA
jgi:hypothetical protein